jgi:hypothetical protein
MSSRVLKTVPNDMGMTVCARMTVSFTRSCARTFWRVGSYSSMGVSLTTAATSRKLTVWTSVGSTPMPMGPNVRGLSLWMTQ